MSQNIDQNGNTLHLQLSKEGQNNNDNDNIGSKHKKYKKHSKKKNGHNLHKNKMNKDKKGKKTIKIKAKIEKIIELSRKKKKVHENESKRLDNQINELNTLLQNCNNMDFKEIKLKMKIIAKANKRERKNGKRFKNKLSKEQKQKKKLERKALKEERKLAKKEKIKKLENARIMELPSKLDSNELLIQIDGYNIVGCDHDCRKLMRGKKGQARVKLMQIVHKFLKENKLDYKYNFKVNVWFDGKGKNIVFENKIPMLFSNNMSVDDTFVEMYTNKDENSKMNVLVITSDKELTLRLNAVGIKVMKSGVFYKTYIKPVLNGNNVLNNDDKKINENDNDVSMEDDNDNDDESTNDDNSENDNEMDDDSMDSIENEFDVIDTPFACNPDEVDE